MKTTHKRKVKGKKGSGKYSAKNKRKANPVYLYGQEERPQIKLAAFCPNPNCDGNCAYQGHPIKSKK